VAKEPIDLRNYRIRLLQTSPQTVPIASNLAFLGFVEKLLQEIYSIMLTTTELGPHRRPPLRYDGLHRGTADCTIQHLIVGLLQVAQDTEAFLPRATAIGNMLLQPLQHGWCANQHLRHAAQIARLAEVSNATQGNMSDRLP